MSGFPELGTGNSELGTENGDTEKMKSEELKQRTKAFALRVIKLVQALPKTDVGRVIGRQLLRSGTSVWANYRAA